MKKAFISLATIGLCLMLFVVTAHVASAQVVPGCFPGNAFSTANGAACGAGSVDTGCTAGNTYSTVTGAACVPAPVTSVPTVPGLPNTGTGPIAGLLGLSALILGLIAATVLSLRTPSYY